MKSQQNSSLKVSQRKMKHLTHVSLTHIKDVTSIVINVVIKKTNGKCSSPGEKLMGLLNVQFTAWVGFHYF